MWDFILSLLERAPSFLRWFQIRRFSQIFGVDVKENYHIIYGIKIVPVEDRKRVFYSPPSKIHRPLLSHATNLSSINSCATTRSLGHLIYSFGKNVGSPPSIDSDVDMDDKMDISFISIGGLGNRKTVDILEEVSNFLRFEGNSITFIDSPLVTTGEHDYAFVIKTHPKSNPERTWICCAGVSEWGTSGAAWYLATKWKNIRKWAKDKPFAVITKTPVNADQRTELVYKFLKHTDSSEFTQLNITP